MRVLTVDQMGLAICRLTCRQQQRVAVLSHEGVRREHRSQTESPIPQRSLCHSHKHSVDERLVTASRSALMVVH